MFKGFNLKTQLSFQNYYNIGQQIYHKMKKEVEGNIDKYVCKDGSLDGTKIQSDWFPQIKANIFISHSHKDEDLAIGIAGWLYNEFGLVSFIDSCVWGYSNQLLRKIDDIYCLNDNSESSYNYEKRNYSTSHVHMMLSMALTMMIDKTECIFFLNTSNSTCSTKDTIKNQTNSPWIYSEIVTTKVIQKKNLPEDRMKKLEIIKKALNEYAQLNVHYDLDFKHLYALNDTDLIEWQRLNTTKGTESLDNLYKLIINN